VRARFRRAIVYPIADPAAQQGGHPLRMVRQQPPGPAATAPSMDPVPHRIGDTKLQQPRLACPEDLAGSAQAQVLLGDDEAVRVLRMTVSRRRALSESGARYIRTQVLFCAAAPHPPRAGEAGEPQSLRVLDESSGFARGHPPDLDHRRRDQDWVSPAWKAAIAASFSAGRRRPWTSPTVTPGRLSLRRAAVSCAASASRPRTPNSEVHTQ